jgi:hypothetical protein
LLGRWRYVENLGKWLGNELVSGGWDYAGMRSETAVDILLNLYLHGQVWKNVDCLPRLRLRKGHAAGFVDVKQLMQAEGACLDFCCTFDLNADFQHLCCLSRQQAAVKERSPEALRRLQHVLQQASYCGISSNSRVLHSVGMLPTREAERCSTYLPRDLQGQPVLVQGTHAIRTCYFVGSPLLQNIARL